jgi:speckle-type POZ protein
VSWCCRPTGTGTSASGLGADVTFRVAGETFAAHRFVLAARSPIFKAELLGRTTTGEEGGVCIRIDGACSRRCYITCTRIRFPEMTEQEEGTMAGHLLVAADRYGMHRLKLICGETLSEHIGLDTVATILAPLAESTDDMMPEANDGLHFCTLQTLPRLTW